MSWCRRHTDSVFVDFGRPPVNRLQILLAKKEFFLIDGVQRVKQMMWPLCVS